ncbi:hypothetical protein HD806DRAFT_485721 [Xylariaceae sp. AK1471]|nr:hypothetical protein HD806DRAFT_485721 [Xylariaceae sp. AK1471]
MLRTIFRRPRDVQETLLFNPTFALRLSSFILLISCTPSEPRVSLPIHTTVHSPSMERRERKDEVRAIRQVFMDECFANRDKIDPGIERKLQPAEIEEMRIDRAKLDPPLAFAEFKEFCNSAKQFLRQSGLNPESVHQKQTSTSSCATSWPATNYVELYDDLFLWMILPVTFSHTRYYLKDEFSTSRVSPDGSVRCRARNSMRSTRHLCDYTP